MQVCVLLDAGLIVEVTLCAAGEAEGHHLSGFTCRGAGI